jgi:hypothetical protein
MKKLLPFFFTLTFLSIYSTGFALTAFQAEPYAEKMLSDQARGKLVKIVGIRGAGIEPVSWKFLSYDPYASQNGRVVTITGKAVTEIRDGYSELDNLRLAAYKEDEIIPKDQLKVDSDKAFKVVQNSAQLSKVKITSVQYVLEKSSGGAVTPVWKLTLYADVKGHEAEIGNAKISAETGQIYELKVDQKKLVN